jgi:hypothetical protein
MKSKAEVVAIVRDKVRLRHYALSTEENGAKISAMAVELADGER